MSGRNDRALRKTAKAAALQTRAEIVEPLTVLTKYAKGIEDRAKALEKTAEDLEFRTKAMDEQTQALAGRTQELEAHKKLLWSGMHDYKGFKARGLWGRISWLLLGS